MFRLDVEWRGSWRGFARDIVSGKRKSLVEGACTGGIGR